MLRRQELELGEDCEFVVCLDEAQLLDESVVAHVGCARKMVACLRHCFRVVSSLGWVGGVSLGKALEILGGGGLYSGFAEGMLGWVQHFAGDMVCFEFEIDGSVFL